MLPSGSTVRTMGGGFLVGTDAAVAAGLDSRACGADAGRATSEDATETATEGITPDGPASAPELRLPEPRSSGGVRKGICIIPFLVSS